jgi:uncharacterized protein YbjT (DUF2867 family)
MKVAGTKEAFRAVDLHANVAVAKAAKAAGAKRLGLVSALGADASSFVFYNKIKGLCEDEIAKIGLDHVVFARPSLLDGERTEARRGEEISLRIARAVPFLIPNRYKAIAATTVARALVSATLATDKTRLVLESEQLAILGADPRHR